MLLVASALALGEAGSVEERMLREATASGVALAAHTLAPVLVPADAARPITGDRHLQLVEIVEQGVLAAADPCRLLALLAGAGAVLSGLVLARSLTRAVGRPEGFDEDVLRSAIVGRRRAERERDEALAKAEHLAAELERAKAQLREAEQRPREELSAAHAEIRRLEELRDGLQERAAKAEGQVAELEEMARELGARVRALERAKRAETLLAEIEAELERLHLLPELRTDRPEHEPPGARSAEALPA